jgi:hypothetical protein
MRDIDNPDLLLGVPGVGPTTMSIPIVLPSAPPQEGDKKE